MLAANLICYKSSCRFSRVIKFSLKVVKCEFIINVANSLLHCLLQTQNNNENLKQ